ncbi:CheR family methyltransferase [Halodurantibacterium flavum]|uniref:Chemotaxis protein methyltransferase n=1 Tax=Halodurantibacterium flavum TaxID=1382802 RepID=A0ABW4S5C2_9RHOB
MSRAEFGRIAKLVYSESGIVLPDSKQPLVVSRLSKRLRVLGLGSFSDYVQLVEGAQGQDERGCMISALTTNVTRFLREIHHFEQLRQEVLPPLIAEARRGRRVRIWSAGCSTGEEPYSIAFTLLDACPEAARLDIKILATDIDPEVIATAQRGIYPAQALSPLPPATLGKYLQPRGAGQHEVTEAVRELLSFRVLNLLAQWPFRGPFDVIFCRNVVIYLDAETKETLWQRYASVLAPGGYLFIGHSERVSATAMGYFQTAGVTAYRRSGAGQPGPATAPH